MKNLLENKKLKAILAILGGCIIVLLVFGLGIVVGYKKAMFASIWSRNYFHNFYALPPAGIMGMMGMHDIDETIQMPFSLHGAAGEVIDVATGTLSVQNPFGNEQSIVVLPETMIRTFDGGTSLDDIGMGEWVTVIGAPNPSGQIEARFIRVFPTSSVEGTDGQ